MVEAGFEWDISEPPQSRYKDAREVCHEVIGVTTFMLMLVVFSVGVSHDDVSFLKIDFKQTVIAPGEKAIVSRLISSAIAVHLECRQQNYN